MLETLSKKKKKKKTRVVRNKAYHRQVPLQG